MTAANAYDLAVALVVAWSGWQTFRRPTPAPTRRHQIVRGARPAPASAGRSHIARAPRTSLSVVAGGDEYDLALARFEQARRRCSTWEPGR